MMKKKNMSVGNMRMGTKKRMMMTMVVTMVMKREKGERKMCTSLKCQIFLQWVSG